MTTSKGRPKNISRSKQYIRTSIKPQKITPKTQISTNQPQKTQQSTNNAITNTIRMQQHTKPHKDDKNHKGHLFERKEPSRSTFAIRVQLDDNISATQRQHRCNSVANRQNRQSKEEKNSQLYLSTIQNQWRPVLEYCLKIVCDCLINRRARVKQYSDYIT